MISNNQLQALTDSIAQTINDFTTTFMNGTASGMTTILGGYGGSGSSNTLGRILRYQDLTSDVTLLGPANQVNAAIASYITSIRTLAPFYTQLFPLFDAIDKLTGGLNTFLTSNAFQVNGSFANAFNAYALLAVNMGFRSPASIPSAISAANYFPSAAIDQMWSMTAATATTFSSNAVGINTSTIVVGGGVGQFGIYKSGAGNAAGGATFTITYTTPSGGTATATYTTTSGTPAASGSIGSAYSISGLIGSAITGVTGTGMTAGETYVLCMPLVRAASY